MSITSYSRFLSECIIHDASQQLGLRDDEVWGVFLSWCSVTGQQPGGEENFWEAMHNLGLGRTSSDDGGYICRGLTMTGPAAVDYILSSQPSLV